MSTDLRNTERRGRMKDRAVLVTGAARGIGRATAELLAREGAYVVVTDVRDDEGVAVADALGRPAVYQRLDVRREGEWKEALSFIEDRFGRLDVLVNNAGVTGVEEDLGPQDPEHATLEGWHAIHATNLDGVFLGCKHAIQTMRRMRNGGSIVNVSSRSGLVGIPGAAAYASSKAAVRNHTKSVALYCAEQGLEIRCNSVHPAAILTPMWEPMLGKEHEEREARMRALTKDTPLRRFGTPEEVAYAVLYLASDEAAYVTGTELNLDGGILAGSAASPTAEY